MATNAPAKASEPIGERRVYHGEVSDDDWTEITVEGHIGYSRVVTMKIESWCMRAEFNMCPATAREIARHLNEAADSAVAARADKVGNDE